MTGAVWAATSGVGFGAFQTVNRRAVARMDVYVATLLQLAVALVALAVLVAADGDERGRITSLPLVAGGWFVLGGITHFLVGWTLLNMSQQRVGAARTSPLIATVPLFGAAVALVTLGEVPPALSWAGIGLITLGAYVVAADRLLRGAGGGPAVRWRDSVYGLACAAAWSISPVFIRKGLDDFDSPLLGVTIGLAASLAGYVALLAFGEHRWERERLGDAVWLKVLAGVLVALSTWGRWVALERTSVGAVLALGLMSVPVVLVLSPLLMGREVERVDTYVWLGAGLVVAGSLLLVARGR